VFFDDLHILRTIDRLEQAEITAPLYSAVHLLPEVTNHAPVYEDRDYRNFIREPEDLKRFDFVDFRLMQYAGVTEPSKS
jgi:hypothetical protein